MGLENRDYVRDNSPYSGGSYGARRLPGASGGVVKKIIIVTVAAFILQSVTNGKYDHLFQMDGPMVYGAGQIWRTLTYAFMHSRQSLMHIAFNMLGLYWFGRELEQMYGSREFLLFYLCAAVFAAIVQMATGIVTGVTPPMVGASGSVMGLLALYAMHFPRRKALIWGVLPVEMRFLIPIVVVMDVVMNKQFGQHIAQSAHIGGLLFGIIYFLQKIRLERVIGGNVIGNIQKKATDRKARRKLKVFAPDEPSSPTPSGAISEQVDHILAKIHSEGESSLTDSERKVLSDASRIARDRKST